MRRLVLHIGHPKTGTTALQSVLSANSDFLLRELSLLYPTKTTPAEYKHAYSIPWLLKSDNESIRRRAREDGEALKSTSKTYWQSVIAEIRSNSPNAIILSAEGFWSILRRADQESRDFFRQNIYSICDHAEVTAYIKSPAAYFLSKINQKLRNYRQVYLPRPDYISAAITEWESLEFNAYTWKVFDRKALLNGDIVDDFCAQHIPMLSPGSLTRKSIEQANESVSNEAMQILEDVTAQYPILREDVYDPRRSKVVSMLRDADVQIGGNARPSLTEDARMRIIRRSTDLAWLQARGLCFSDIDPAWIHQTQHGEPQEAFTRVADFCPIDVERLADLRAATKHQIKQLFAARSQRFFWPFRRRQ